MSFSWVPFYWVLRPRAIVVHCLLNAVAQRILTCAISMARHILRYFQATNRELKRLDSIARSPIYAYFEQCLNGLSTIRAYQAEGQVATNSARRLDAQTRLTLALFSSNRWLSIRLELLGGFMILICAIFLVAGRKVIDPGTVGLALSYALQITGLLNMTVRLAAVAENSFNAVERVTEYADVAAEKVEAPTGAPKAPPDWPSAGAIEFNGVSMKYREHEKPVLNALDFSVKPGQKIGTGTDCTNATLPLYHVQFLHLFSLAVDLLLFLLLLLLPFLSFVR